jgi:hypothetical protein
MDLTKGMECPRCGNHARFQGGSFGGPITTTNAVCDCGFGAWIIIKREGYEYSVSATKLNDVEGRIYKFKHYDDRQLLELSIKYNMAYDMIDAIIRPSGMYDVIVEIKEEIAYREGLKNE